MIIFDRVSKRYPNGREALTQRHFRVHRRDGFLTGRSGAGQSTVLKLIALLERPTRGKRWWSVKEHEHDESAATSPFPASHGVGVSDTAAGRPAVFDNVALPLVVAGAPFRDVDKRVRAALDRWDSWAKSGCCPWSCRWRAAACWNSPRRGQ